MSELPQTERSNARTQGLDVLPTDELAALLAAEQQSAVDAVRKASRELAIAIDEIATRLRAGGVLHYVGAGTSGRLGFLDASEMPPTFGTKPELVCAHIAGGPQALTRAIEGAEDDAAAGEAVVTDHVKPGDALVGVSASGGAPFVVAAVRAARGVGAWTMGMANVPQSDLIRAGDLGVLLDTGPEPLTGSTRLKAGTSQKIALNTISTAVMIRLGKVYDNLMVDVVATNAKLRGRALRLVMGLTKTGAAEAQDLLQRAGGSVKTAAAMHARGVDASQARALLDAANGSLRAVLQTNA
ncbi:MAG TPA: N-acetylmuramic acid 6-phosphate etherase [Candidatus Baltobacteraceae bacterium]|nr:N-acetylmuramic acid 6-phosphate etherase [Candidatus Baltobacteraceae bacterium]